MYVTFETSVLFVLIMFDWWLSLVLLCQLISPCQPLSLTLFHFPVVAIFSMPLLSQHEKKGSYLLLMWAIKCLSKLASCGVWLVCYWSVQPFILHLSLGEEIMPLYLQFLSIYFIYSLSIIYWPTLALCKMLMSIVKLS